MQGEPQRHIVGAKTTTTIDAFPGQCNALWREAASTGKQEAQRKTTKNRGTLTNGKSRRTLDVAVDVEEGGVVLQLLTDREAEGRQHGDAAVRDLGLAPPLELLQTCDQRGNGEAHDQVSCGCSMRLARWPHEVLHVPTGWRNRAGH